MIPYFNPPNGYTLSGPAMGNAVGSASFSSTVPYVVSYTKGSTASSESDETGRSAGAGASPPEGSGTGNDTPEYGFTTGTGTSVQIKNDNGNETVELSHFTGARIVIDSDGSIHLMPVGKKGFGLHAGRGRGLLYAHADLVLKSDSAVFIESGGNLEVNVKNDFLLNVGGNMITSVDGNNETTVRGSSVEEIAHDKSEIIAGQQRITIAGDTRTQVAGAVRFDVGKSWDQRVKQRLAMSSQESAILQSKANLDLASQNGALTASSKEDVVIQTQKAARVIGKTSVTIDAEDSGVFIRGKEEVLISSKQDINIDSENNIVIRSDAIRMDTDTTFDVRSGSVLELNSTDFVNVGAKNVNINATEKLDGRGDNIDFNAPSGIDMRGTPLNLNLGGPSSPASPLVPGQKQTTTPRTPIAPDEIEPPEFVDANTIIDSQTTRREHPEFPINARGKTTRTLNIYTNEGGDELPGKVRGEAQSNPGITDGGTVIPGNRDVLGADGRPPPENTSKATQNPLPVPSLSNGSAKLSKYVTVSKYFYGQRAPREHILNAMNLCHNIVDPLVDEFARRGVTLIVAPIKGAGYRIDRRSSSNHTTGEAVDIQPSSAANYQLGFEIAEWVWRNLPYRAILFEITKLGNTLIHFESAKPGQGAGGKIETCSDNRCRENKVSGLDWSQYTIYLRQRGIK